MKRFKNRFKYNVLRGMGVSCPGELEVTSPELDRRIEDVIARKNYGGFEAFAAFNYLFHCLEPGNAVQTMIKLFENKILPASLKRNAARAGDIIMKAVINDSRNKGWGQQWLESQKSLKKS